MIQGFCQLDLDVDRRRGMPPICIWGHHILCLRGAQVLLCNYAPTFSELVRELLLQGTTVLLLCRQDKELMCIKQGLSPALATLRWTHAW